MKIELLITSLYIITIVLSGCPNMCNSHGTCENDGTCTCITNQGVGVNQGRFSLQAYTGPDCSQRTCPVGLSFSITNVEGIIPDRVKDQTVSIQQRWLEEGLPGYLETDNLILVEINNTVIFGKYGGSMRCERITTTSSEETETNLRFLYETEEDGATSNEGDKTEEGPTTKPEYNILNTTTISNINVLAQSGKYLLVLWDEEMKKLYGEKLILDSTTTDSQTSEEGLTLSNTLQCTVLSQRTDLSLTIITSFEDDIYNKDDNSMTELDEDYSSSNLYNATIPYYNRLLSYNNFTNDIIYNFACISNLETKLVQVYDSIIANDLYKANNNNNNNVSDEITFLLNTTNLPEGPCYFLGDGRNNIKIEKSEVYKKYMSKIGNDIYFAPKQMINSVNGYKDGVSVYKGSDGLDLVISTLKSENKTISDIKIENINYESDNDEDDDDFLIKASYIDIDSFFGNNKNEVLVHLKVGSILQFIVTQNRITYIKIYVITKIIFINYNGDICDSTGKVIKPRIDSSKNKRILQSQNTNTNNNNINNNNNNLIMVFTTEPPFDNLVDAKVVYTVKSQDNAHKYLECSGSGLCNRNTGKCECFVGFEGDACQRISCPFNCNNHGRCVTISEAINGLDKDNKILNKFGYNGGDNDSEKKFYACLCDSGYRGADCSLRECPSFSDPERATNQRDNKDGISPLVGVEHRDCSGRGICDYSTGNCKCFDGFVGTGCESIASVS